MSRRYTRDNALWFYTDAEGDAGGGVLLGDYAAEGIRGVRCDIEIASLADFDFVDCAVLATGSAGKTYYYSENFSAEDFTEAGWWILEFSFGAEWFYFDGEKYVPVEVTPGLLASIEEVGFRFFPKEGTTAEIFAAVDNVKLVPTVGPTRLAVSQVAGRFEIAFTPGRGVACTVERTRQAPGVGWQDVPGHSGIVGDSVHVFSTPVSELFEFFRVRAVEHYTPFESGEQAP